MFRINSCKGQSFSLDVLTALIIFALTISFITFLYSNLLNSSNSLVGEKISLERKAFVAMNFLTNSKGNPINWVDLNSIDVNTIGLLNNELSVSEEKLSKFINFDYNESKEKLGLNGLEYFFSFSGADSVESGLPLSVDLDSIVLTRVVSYKGGEAVVKLTVYKI